jgi:hypothetical protein
VCVDDCDGGGRSIITAQATASGQQLDSAPLVIGGINGEKIEKVQVSAAYGGNSSLTYVTASGREVPAWCGGAHLCRAQT